MDLKIRVEIEKVMNNTTKIFFLIILCAGGVGHRSYAGMEIRRSEKEGRKVIEIENDFYRMTLVPEIARLPLTYFFKPTGHEEFIHPVGLDIPNVAFQYYGGIVDSIPWVSGTVNGKSLPEKGCLYSSQWQWRIGKRKNFVYWEGKTRFEYPDPITEEKPNLTILLKPGEKCCFTLYLAAYQGISIDEIQQVDSVYPECLVLTQLKVLRESNKIRGRRNGVFSL